jgi:hypothetical protein
MPLLSHGGGNGSNAKLPDVEALLVEIHPVLEDSAQLDRATGNQHWPNEPIAGLKHHPHGRDLAVVAAILAVVGYSINDTIIVFDRIRERFEANRRLDTATALDQSINQTLSRTIMTKVTTLIVVVALLFLGGPVLRGFSEALIVGILAGTYSSIYISAAVALDLGLKAEHVFPVVSKRPIDDLP